MTAASATKMLSGEPTTEALQQLILSTLDAQGSIPDTTALRLDETAVDQQTVLGVLKRLEAHEVLRAVDVPPLGYSLPRPLPLLCRWSNMRARRRRPGS